MILIKIKKEYIPNGIQRKKRFFFASLSKKHPDFCLSTRQLNKQLVYLSTRLLVNSSTSFQNDIADSQRRYSFASRIKIRRSWNQYQRTVLSFTLTTSPNCNGEADCKDMIISK